MRPIIPSVRGHFLNNPSDIRFTSHSRVESRVRPYVLRGAYHVFCDIADIQRGEPASGIDVFEVEASARVGGVAPDDPWREDAPGHIHVFHCDVTHGHASLSVAFFDQGVQHAAWAATIWLFLLLGTNVDAPPERIFYFKVVIDDVFNQTIALFTWV